MLNKLFFSIFVLSISACKPVSEHNGQNTATKLIPQCINSQSICEIKTEFSSYIVKFSQHTSSSNIKGKLLDNITTELPFSIELSQINTQIETKIQTNSELNTTKVSAYLEGRDMFMGKVPVFFEREGESNIYSAESLLASCSEDQMVWRLWVTIDMTGKTETFFVDFTSQRL